LIVRSSHNEPKILPVVLGSGLTDTEESRTFYQDRLRLLSGCLFLISGGFYIIGTTTRLVALGTVTPLPVLLWTPGVLHLTATLLAGCTWLLFRGVRFSFPALRRLDAATALVLCTCFALTGAAVAFDSSNLHPDTDPDHGVFVGLLASSYVVLARATALPSKVSRTVWIGAAAMVPIVAVNVYVLLRGGTGGVMLALGSVEVLSWTAAAVTLAAISSRVIFGLHTEAAKIRRLGQYTLEEKVGEGGMGIVYRGYHAMLRRPTAIKLLPPEKVGETSIRRFEREVQLTARLTHPNTVAVFDYGRTPDGLFYYAMEYLDGLNLEQLVKQDGPQAPGRVVHLLAQACGALAEAHDIGLVHGDIKPANILLVDRGGMPDVVKVVDFGLVKRVEHVADDATLTVTAGNVLKGTPLYLSPEAIRNDPVVDGRSDLYALGAVGYFLITGRPVFEATSVVEIFAHHLHTQPTAPSRWAPHPVPQHLESAILQCLAKDPAERPADALTLSRILLGCPCKVPWSADDAIAWWAAHRRRQGASRGVRAASKLPTLTVDIQDRIRA